MLPGLPVAILNQVVFYISLLVGLYLFEPTVLKLMKCIVGQSDRALMLFEMPIYFPLSLYNLHFFAIH